MTTEGASSEGTSRVLVLGATFNTDNMGVSALASGAISLLARRYPGAEICFLDYGRDATVSTVSAEGATVRVPLINLRFSWKLLLPNNVAYLLILAGLCRLFGERFAQRAARGNPWLQAIRGSKVALAVSGGDSFSDIYGLGRFFYVYLPQLLVVALGRRLVLLPQTIGPFRTALARHLASHLMRRALRVYSRDQAGVQDAQAVLGGDDARSRARFCYDLGFVLEPRRPRGRSIEQIEALKQDGRLLVGVNVSGLLLMGGYDRDNAFGLRVDYRELVDRTIDFLVHAHDANVVLIPHVFGTHPESDVGACVALHDALRARYGGRIACVRDDLDQNEVKYLIGRCDFFVGARMHACIAALSQAVPAVGIAYSRKFIGVFETVGAGGLVADPRRMSTDEILAVIGGALGLRERIAADLAGTMVKVRRDLFAALDGIAA